MNERNLPVADDALESLKHVSANEIAQAVEQHKPLTAEQRAYGDVNHDGVVDEEDVEVLAKAELALANKISGAIVGMEALTQDEQEVADRNHDGHINLTDSYRLADDARAARSAEARIKRAKTGKLQPPQ